MRIWSKRDEKKQLKAGEILKMHIHKKYEQFVFNIKSYQNDRSKEATKKRQMKERIKQNKRPKIYAKPN